MWGDIAIAFLLSFITAFAVTPYTIKLAKRVGAIDLPKDDRRINKKPMPRLGGLAVIAGFLISITYLITIMSIEGTINLVEEQYYIKLSGFFLGTLVIIITCFIDDVKGTIGEKIRNAKILGIPYVAIMGNNTEEGFIELERTKDGEKKTFAIEDLVKEIENMKWSKKDITF